MALACSNAAIKVAADEAVLFAWNNRINASRSLSFCFESGNHGIGLGGEVIQILTHAGIDAVFCNLRLQFIHVRTLHELSRHSSLLLHLLVLIQLHGSMLGNNLALHK